MLHNFKTILQQYTSADKGRGEKHWKSTIHTPGYSYAIFFGHSANFFFSFFYVQITIHKVK